MKHRLILTLGLAALVCSAVAATASAGRGGNGRSSSSAARSSPRAPTSVQITVEGGNHAALRAMLGQSQNQTFTLGTTSEVLVWSHGIPKVGTYADLKTTDWVQVNVRAKGRLVALGDRGERSRHRRRSRHRARQGRQATLPLPRHLRRIADGREDQRDVKGGNRLALRSLLGQSNATQTFSYDSNTIFLLWQGKVPTVIGAADLKAGDRITVRIRAPRLSSLSTIESTPARHVGEHEPANANDKS